MHPIETVAVLIGDLTLLSMVLDPLTCLWFVAQRVHAGHISGFVIGTVVGWSD